MQRRLSAAVVAATILLAALASTTSAECMAWPLEATEQPHVAYAFVAEVIGVEPEELFEEGSGQFRYKVSLKTEQTYRGRVPDQLELTGLSAGCSFVSMAALAEGETLFVTSEQLNPGEWETWFGDVLVWRQVGSAWDFDEDALAYGSDEDYYWPAARAATTTASILRIVSEAPLPDTGTASERDQTERGSFHTALMLLVVFGLASIAVYRGRPDSVGR